MLVVELQFPVIVITMWTLRAQHTHTHAHTTWTVPRTQLLFDKFSRIDFYMCVLSKVIGGKRWSKRFSQGTMENIMPLY